MEMRTLTIDGKVYKGTLHEIKKQIATLAKKRALRAAKKTVEQAKPARTAPPKQLPEFSFDELPEFTVTEAKKHYVDSYVNAHRARVAQLRMRVERVKHDEEEMELLLLA